MATNTPIPYWMSKPWGEVRAWDEVVGAIQKKDREERG